MRAYFTMEMVIFSISLGLILLLKLIFRVGQTIRENIKSQKKIEYMAFHDNLTGLPNRNMLDKYLRNNFAVIGDSDSHKRYALLFINLDRFKVVNDTLGHLVGDLLLIEITIKLQATLNEEDRLFRQGKDEFFIVVENANQADATDVANRIIKVLSSPISIGNYDVFTSPSIGISLFPDHGGTPEIIIQRADSAMYKAKNAGKNTFKFYSLNSNQHHLNLFQLEMDLHKAHEYGEFILHYQPKVNLQTGKLIGTEALIRWNHPKLGMIPPGNFIPIAEESGLIIPIGEWVLEAACWQNKIWHEKGLVDLVISVNLSARQFLTANLVDKVKKILIKTGLEPRFLELEITESMTADIERTKITLQQLKNLGVRISIDDFGTGFSSLNYLKQLPVDTLKIDKSFVSELQHNTRDQTITKTIISMAHNLKLSLVAEGIETKEQLAFLQRHLCEGGQGYLFSRPIPPEEIELIVDEVEQFVHNFTVSPDVSERMWTEELIRIAKLELQETVHKQKGMLLKYKKLGNRYVHTMCDGALVYRLGYTPEGIIGKDLKEFLSPKMAEEKTKFYERAWNGEENVIYEEELNGVYYLATLTPIRKEGEVVEVIGSCVDITERRKTETTLIKSEANYRQIVEQITDLIMMFDINGNFLYVSPSFEVVLGKTMTYYLGKNVFREFHPDEHEANALVFENLLRRNEPQQKELRLATSNAGWFLFDTVLTPVLDKDGNVMHIVGVARDITEQKKNGEQYWKSEKLSVIGELAAGVAHEIKNPMTTIKGFLQLFEEGTFNSSYFKVVLDEFGRMEEIIDELFTLGNPKEIVCREVKISNILREVEMLVKSEANMRNIEIIKEFQEDLPIMNWDQNQMMQVFINLIENSIEALPKGGKITLHASATDKDMIINVIDNGIGISNERIKKLCEPYYSRKEKGTGLGLMQSFLIIRQHKGTITFKSKVDEGTVAEIKVPIQKVISS